MVGPEAVCVSDSCTALRLRRFRYGRPPIVSRFTALGFGKSCLIMRRAVHASRLRYSVSPSSGAKFRCGENLLWQCHRNMALSHDVLSQTVNIVWIIALFLTESVSKKTAVYYMDGGSDCDVDAIGLPKTLGGATVLSHQFRDEKNSHYGDNIECRIGFKAENEGWRLMLRVEELDMTDRAPYSPYLCKDALYIYDTDSIIGTPMKEAGGNAGLCGRKPPQVLYSTGPYLTVYFRSDRDGKRGRGFKLVITAFSDDYRQHPCGANFMCDNTYCIDGDLRCDSVNHCGDSSDEAGLTGAACDMKEDNLLTKFLSLGVTATIAISVGSVVVFVVVLATVVCCCVRCCRPSGNDQNVVQTMVNTPTHHSVITNGSGSQHPTIKVKSSEYLISSDHGVSYHQPMFGPQGYHPMHTVYSNSPSTTYSPFISQRDAYTPSHAPPSYHRSFTPTSSRSAKSHRSDSSNVTYHTNHDKVNFPAHV